MSSCDGARVDCRWKPLREGEMSPFKMLVALFIREVYAVAGSGSGTTTERAVAPKTLLLIYNLISSYDMDTFSELKTTLEKPIHAVRPEALKKFNRILANLEPNNSYFLYELANSIVSMESSQMVVLKKRISKNSPFGKFLRGIYLNVKKLSYPQVDYMYKQLLHFLGIVPGEGSTHPHNAHHHHTPSRGGKDKDKIPRVLKGLDLFQKLEERKDGDGLDLEVFHTYMMEYKKMTGSASESEKASYEIHSDWKVAKAKNASEKATSSLRKLWQSPHLTTTTPTQRTNYNNTNNHSKIEKDEFMTSSSGGGSTSTTATLATPFPIMMMSCSDDDDGENNKDHDHDHASPSGRSKSVTRRSPRSAQPDNQPPSIKRVTRSSSSPIGKGGKSSKRRSSSLRRIYFSSPRPNTSILSPSPNIPGSAPHPPPVASSSTPAVRSMLATSSASNKGSFSSFSSPLLKPIPGLPRGERKIQLVDTGAYKIRLKLYPDGTPGPPSTGRIIKTDDNSKKPSSSQSKVKNVPITLPLTDDDDDDDDNDAHGEFDEDFDVVMKSPSPMKSHHPKQQAISTLPTTSTPTQPPPTPSSSSIKSPRSAGRKVILNTPAVKLSSDDDHLHSEFAIDSPIISSGSTGMIRLPELELVVQLTPLSQLQLTPIKKHTTKSKSKKVDRHPQHSSTRRPTKPTTTTTDAHDEGWNVIKRWSRKQIERAIKSLMERIYSANCGVPSPSEVSQFVRVALTNPSGSVLFPHLHYLEYLNCLRIKDVARCTDSLRASFDVRIKPNTTELNKGTTYAAYNAALFYHQIGYKDDAASSLDEAFRAGHAAGDATCLHHCHNLWSSFHSRSYTDAIVTVTKEVDNNMAYLHSLNVIVNAFDVNSQKVAPDETLHSLWHYNADCDLEEMEGLLLSALSNLYSIYGWHEMIAFPTQMILFANWKWSSRFYAFALCSLSQCLLYHADVQVSIDLMEYGRKIFEFDASLAGQHFLLQSAIFQALKSYLAYEPVSSRVLGTISAFDEIEAVYWKGYNLMIGNNYREATTLLKKFLKYLDAMKEDTYKGYLGTDLKLRCFLLLAELECLCQTPSGAISYLSDALEIATSVHSDVYTTLCLYSAAAVQCAIGLEKTSSLTIEKKLRSAIRCASPWLKSRMNVIKAKIRMRVEKTVTQEKRLEIMGLLNESESLYLKWGNNYRVMEILDAKAELIERSEDLEQDGSVESEFRKKLEEMETDLEWTKETCIL